MMSPTIIIGAGNCAVLDSIDSDNVDLVVMPGERAPEPRSGLRIHAPKDLPQALLGLRCAYSTHPVIASIAGASVIDSHEVARPDERASWSKAIKDFLASLLQDIGNCPTDTWYGARNAILNGSVIARSTHTGHFKNSLRKTPAICIAAGPSAQAHLPAIRMIQESHVIFACDAMLNACVDAGITPHFVTAIERIPELPRMFDRHGGCGARLIAPPVLDPASFAKFPTQPILWWAADDLYRWIDGSVDVAYSGRSAGTIQVAAALLAGCNPIYLVGHDLAYKDGQSHATGFTRIYAPEIDRQVSDWDFMRQRSQVPKNGGGEVETSGIWRLFRADIEHMLADYPDRDVYNINRNEGAVIAGAKYSWLPLDLGGRVMLPDYPTTGIPDIRDRIPSIAEDITKLERAARGYADAIEHAETKRDLDLIAQAMTVGALVSADNAWLFRYVLRNLYNSLLLRLHLRQSDGMNAQRSALRILTSTIPGMCAMMRKDLSC
jgi:hypothetical protein